MPKFRFFITSFLVVSLVSGCSWFAPSTPGGTVDQSGNKAPSIDAEQIIRDSFAAMAAIDTMHFKVTPSINVDSPDMVGTFELALEGDTDMSNKNTPQGQMTLEFNMKGNSNDEQANVEAKAKMIALDNVMYLVLQDLKLDVPDMKDFSAMVEPYLGQWYFLSSDEMKSADSPLGMAGMNDLPNKLSDKQKEDIRKLIKKTDFFDVTKINANTKIDNVEVYHFSVALNEDNLIDFVEGVANIMDENMSNSDKDNLKTSLDLVDFEGDLYIGVDDNYLYKMKGQANIQTPDNAEGVITITIQAELSNFDEKLDLKAPEDAEDLMSIIQEMLAPMFNDMGNMNGLQDIENLDKLDSGNLDNASNPDNLGKITQ